MTVSSPTSSPITSPIAPPVPVPPPLDVLPTPQTQTEKEKVGELKIAKKEQVKEQATVLTFTVPEDYDEEAAFAAAIKDSLKAVPVKRLTPSTESWMTTEISYVAQWVISREMPAVIERTLISHKEQITPEAKEKIKKLDAYAMNTARDVEKQAIDVLESLNITHEAKEHSHKDLLRILKVYAEGGIFAVKAEFS